MTYQAYLDTIEEKTGLVPRKVLELARSKGFDQPGTKAGEVIARLKDDYGLGHGHSMAVVQLMKVFPVDPPVGSVTSTPRGESIWIEGSATNPG